MQGHDDTLRERVSRAWPGGDPPTFGKAWHAAQQRQERFRRRLIGLVSAALVVATVVVVMHLQAPEAARYIEVAELLDSTYWTAPSDVLLPERQYDFYQDMPVIFEATGPAGEALL